MHILIVNLSPVEAITSAMIRTLAIARGMAEDGHQVDMVAMPYANAGTKGKTPEFMSEINVIRIGGNKIYENLVKSSGNNGVINRLKHFGLNAARKVWHSLAIYDLSIKNAKQMDIDILPRKEYDVIISSSDPKSSHIAVKSLISQGLKYDRWIQYWGDPLATDINMKSIYPKSVLIKKESNIINGADKIVYVSPFTLNVQKKLFPKYSDIMSFLPIAYMDCRNYDKNENARFTVDYYGSYYTRDRNILPFYQACKTLGSEIEAHIVGDSDLVLEETENISIIPRGIIDELEEKTDLIVCILNNRGTQIPGKIYHAAGTNKKILVVLDGENIDAMREYLESFNRFLICENSEESIMQAILQAQKCDINYFPCEELSYKRISKRLVE